MFNHKRFLALIPARGGSKGLPGKNIRILGDKPLIAWSIDAAKNSKYIDRVIVTTDDEEIVEVAKQYGADIPFMRPAQFAQDDTKMMDVIIHAMEFLYNNRQMYDYLVLLQPTSPFRNNQHIDEAIHCLFKNKAKVILGVTEVEHSPLRMNTLPQDMNMGNFYNSSLEPLNRQEMKKYYRVSGAIYIAEWDFLNAGKQWLSANTYAFPMERKYSVDIDTLEDFLYAQSLLENALIKVK